MILFDYEAQREIRHLRTNPYDTPEIMMLGGSVAAIRTRESLECWQVDDGTTSSVVRGGLLNEFAREMDQGLFPNSMLDNDGDMIYPLIHDKRLELIKVCTGTTLVVFTSDHPLTCVAVGSDGSNIILGVISADACMCCGSIAQSRKC